MYPWTWICLRTSCKLKYSNCHHVLGTSNYPCPVWKSLCWNSSLTWHIFMNCQFLLSFVCLCITIYICKMYNLDVDNNSKILHLELTLCSCDRISSLTIQQWPAWWREDTRQYPDETLNHLQVSGKPSHVWLERKPAWAGPEPTTTTLSRDSMLIALCYHASWLSNWGWLGKSNECCWVVECWHIDGFIGMYLHIVTIQLLKLSRKAVCNFGMRAN